MANTAPGVNAGEKVKVRSTVQSTEQVNRQSPAILANAAGLSRSSIDNSQSNPTSSSSSPTMNNQLSTINKHGFLPRLGPRQFMALLAIVAILLLIGFFVFEKDRNKTQAKADGYKPIYVNSAKILALIGDNQFGLEGSETAKYKDGIKYALETNPDNFRSAVINIKYGCSYKSFTKEDQGRLKQAFDEIIKLIPQQIIDRENSYYSEATESPYVWYCK